MLRLLSAALVLAIALSLVLLAADKLVRTMRTARGTRMRLTDLGATPVQRLSFVLLVALTFYAAIWGAG